MRDIVSINKDAKQQIFKGTKIPHGISNPVIRKVDGKYVLAYFGYTYSKKCIIEKKYDRPVRWAIFDIESGELIETYSCLKHDFSKASFEKKYSIIDPSVKKATAEDYRILDYYIDTVRSGVIYGGFFEKDLYARYLSGICEITPEEYRLFYRELSL